MCVRDGIGGEVKGCNEGEVSEEMLITGARDDPLDWVPDGTLLDADDGLSLCSGTPASPKIAVANGGSERDTALACTAWSIVWCSEAIEATLCVQRVSITRYYKND